MLVFWSVQHVLPATQPEQSLGQVQVPSFNVQSAPLIALQHASDAVFDAQHVHVPLLYVYPADEEHAVLQHVDESFFDIQHVLPLIKALLPSQH